jgi:hypothetical protein
VWSSFSVGVALRRKSGLGTARASAGSVTLPQEDGGAQQSDPKPGQCHRSPSGQRRYDERSYRGNQPGQCADGDDRPRFQQRTGQRWRLEAFARLDRHRVQDSPATMRAAWRPGEELGSQVSPATMRAASRLGEELGNQESPAIQARRGRTR